jgi:hypothetical protein
LDETEFIVRLENARDPGEFEPNAAMRDFAVHEIRSICEEGTSALSRSRDDPMTKSITHLRAGIEQPRGPQTLIVAGPERKRRPVGRRSKKSAQPGLRAEG